MDFAKSFMKKHGWKEGEGLGKNNAGIVKPLKANYKFDNAGLGLDMAADFKNHWWERVYNDAASNLEVKNDDNVSVAIKNKDGLEISTKEYSVKKLQKLRNNDSYSNFLKSATLSASGEVEEPDRIEPDAIGLTKYKALTDEELFAACGGRTAHKGARHGLKLSGKLARIEQQEKELLKKIHSDTTFEINSPDWQIVIGKKRKRNTADTATNPNEIEDLLNAAEYTTKSKKKRKEKNRLENDLASCLNGFNLSEFRKEENNGDIVLDPAFGSVKEKDEDERKTKKKKRKHKKHSDEKNVEVREEFDDQLTVNSLEVNISDSSSSYRSLVKLKHKSKKGKKREKKLMKKLTNSLENSVVITD